MLTLCHVWNFQFLVVYRIWSQLLGQDITYRVVTDIMQVGFTVLEWSKLHMYKTYAKFKDNFGDRLRMGYTDTDALIMITKSDDLYTELKSKPQLRDLIDFSSIPADHPIDVGEPNDPRSGVVGYFKDECSGNIIRQFIHYVCAHIVRPAQTWRAGPSN